MFCLPSWLSFSNYIRVQGHESLCSCSRQCILKEITVVSELEAKGTYIKCLN